MQGSRNSFYTALQTIPANLSVLYLVTSRWFIEMAKFIANILVSNLKFSNFKFPNLSGNLLNLKMV